MDRLVDFLLFTEQEISHFSDIIRTTIQLGILGAILFAVWRDTSLRVLRGAIQDMASRIGKLEGEVRTLRTSLYCYGCRRASECEQHVPFIDDMNLDPEERVWADETNSES